MTHKDSNMLEHLTSYLGLRRRPQTGSVVDLPSGGPSADNDSSGAEPESLRSLLVKAVQSVRSADQSLVRSPEAANKHVLEQPSIRAALDDAVSKAQRRSNLLALGSDQTAQTSPQSERTSAEDPVSGARDASVAKKLPPVNVWDEVLLPFPGSESGRAQDPEAARIQRRFYESLWGRAPPLVPHLPQGTDGSELTEYRPTTRERLAAWLLGDKPSSERSELVRRFMGTTGLGPQQIGVVDFTPAGPGLAAQENAQRRDWQGAALSIIPGVPAARAALVPIRGFNSTAAAALKRAETNRASRTEWESYLRNAGVKEEELNWLGFGAQPKIKGPQWANAQEAAGSSKAIPKQEILDWIQKNEVQIGEKVLTSRPKEIEKQVREARSAVATFVDQMREKYGEAGEWLQHMNAAESEKLKNITAAKIRVEQLARPHAVYERTAIPGGDNYQERLITILQPKFGPYSGDEHWRNQNIFVLGHIRHSDRDIGGKKTLHLEELQSDLHQNKRRFEKNIERLYGQLEQVEGMHANDLQGLMSNPEWFETLHAIDRYVHALEVHPAAPFAKTWPDLFLKRMIRHAAENDYPQISLTPGEIQVARSGKEGNRAWYDQVLVNKLNDIGRPYGAKVQWEDMKGPRKQIKVPVFPITPALREAALRKGFPLFELTPVAAGSMMPLMRGSSDGGATPAETSPFD